MGLSKYALAIVLAIVASYGVKFYAEKSPSTVDFLARVSTSSNLYSRFFQFASGIPLQALGSNPIATFTANELKGKQIVITGGNGGIGYETTKGLVKRGADVIIVGRNAEKIEESIRNIKEELNTEGFPVSSLLYIVADISDLDSVTELVKTLGYHFGDRKIDQLILNAAIWPSEYAESKQGYEIAFATNTLGPHLLVRGLIQQKLLTLTSRVIALTGDIYITVANSADETCTPDFKYGTPAGGAGHSAYCRSKLGMMWLFYELHARVPNLSMYLVHPGVIATGLVPELPLPKFMLVSLEQGAQTTLIAATADVGLLESGGYYHNTLGKVVLPASDPAKNAKKSAEFFALAESLIAPYLQALHPQEQVAEN